MIKKSILEKRIFLKKQLITLLEVEIKSLEELLVMHDRLDDIKQESVIICPLGDVGDMGADRQESYEVGK